MLTLTVPTRALEIPIFERAPHMDLSLLHLPPFHYRHCQAAHQALRLLRPQLHVTQAKTLLRHSLSKTKRRAFALSRSISSQRSSSRQPSRKLSLTSKRPAPSSSPKWMAGAGSVSLWKKNLAASRRRGTTPVCRCNSSRRNVTPACASKPSARTSRRAWPSSVRRRTRGRRRAASTASNETK